MQAVGLDSYKSFNTWAKDNLVQVGNNRQLWQVYLDRCASNERAKLEKV